MQDNPFQSPEYTGYVAEPVSEGARLQYVGFWARLLAIIIDGILMQILMFCVGLVLGFTGLANPLGTNGIGLLAVILQLVIVVWFWVTYGATPGKMAINAKIVDADTGRPITAGQAVGRYLGYIVSGLFFALGFIWIGISPRKQGWHDMLARTVVVRPISGGRVAFPRSSEYQHIS